MEIKLEALSAKGKQILREHGQPMGIQDYRDNLPMGAGWWTLYVWTDGYSRWVSSTNDQHLRVKA